MGSIPPPERKQEVTRKVGLCPPDAIHRLGSATPYQEHIVVWNGPIQALFEYSLEDVETTEAWWLDRIHPEDRENVRESLAQHLIPTPGRPFAADSRIWGSDYRFRNAHGSYILVSDRAVVTRDKHGNALSFESVIFDKHVRRRERETHAKLFESQDHLALIANNTPSGIYMLDPQVGDLLPEPVPTDIEIKGYCIYMNHAGW
jgi:PAS domain-containing protein